MYIGTSPVPLWVEYKVYPNKPTRLQLNILDKLMQHGQKTAIITLHNDHTTIASAGILQKEDAAIWIARTIGVNCICHNQQDPTETTLSGQEKTT